MVEFTHTSLEERRGKKFIPSRQGNTTRECYWKYISTQCPVLSVYQLRHKSRKDLKVFVMNSETCDFGSVVHVNRADTDVSHTFTFWMSSVKFFNLIIKNTYIFLPKIFMKMKYFKELYLKWWTFYTKCNLSQLNRTHIYKIYMKG